MPTELIKRPVVALAAKKTMFQNAMELEGKMSEHPNVIFGNAAAPLNHTFGDGIYIREIIMPAGMLVTSRLHKTTHPYFIMRGDLSIQTEKGLVRIKAPYAGMTEAGTKRILFIHEETLFITVHATNETDVEKIEAELAAEDWEEFEQTLNQEEQI